jgi:DNA-binding MarR family transcriptional regulator
MQATSSQAASAEQLGRQLLDAFQRALRDGGSDLVALFEELDLTITQMKLLHALEGGEMNVKALSGRTRLSLPGTSRAVDALIRRGFVERREDPEDRRSKLLTVTARGREATGRIAAARLEAFERLAARLTDDQRAALSAALDPIATT